MRDAGKNAQSIFCHKEGRQIVSIRISKALFHINLYTLSLYTSLYCSNLILFPLLPYPKYSIRPSSSSPYGSYPSLLVPSWGRGSTSVAGSKIFVCCLIRTNWLVTNRSMWTQLLSLFHAGVTCLNYFFLAQLHISNM